jgi:hypothetical protein
LANFRGTDTKVYIDTTEIGKVGGSLRYNHYVFRPPKGTKGSYVKIERHATFEMRFSELSVRGKKVAPIE